MKKTVSTFLIAFALFGCKGLGLVDPSSELIGTWVHVSSGAAAGGAGSMTYKGTKYSLPQEIKNPKYNITFNKNGVFNSKYFDFDQYKVSGNTITFTNSSTKETYQYDYSIVKNGLALFEKIENFNDPNLTKIDYSHNFDKQ